MVSGSGPNDAAEWEAQTALSGHSQAIVAINAPITDSDAPHHSSLGD
jgi:hypothetical protein